MKKIWRKALTLFMLLVFVGSSAVFLHRLEQYRSAQQSYEQAKALAEAQLEEENKVPMAQTPPAEDVKESEQAPLEEDALYLKELSIDALQKTNAEVRGWIAIPGTVVDYPLMQTKDNSTYLTTAWDGSYNAAGSIFLERRSSADFSDFNTIVYGHYMKNGTMFGALHQFKDADFLAAHSKVYITDGEMLRRYEIYAAYEAEVVSDTYRLIFENEEQKESFLARGTEKTIVLTELTPTTQDKILTLSTCTGNGRYETRWVLQAVLTGEFSLTEDACAAQTSSVQEAER